MEETDETLQAVNWKRGFFRSDAKQLDTNLHARLDVLFARMCWDMERKIEARYPRFRETYVDKNIRLCTMVSLNYHRLIGSTMSQEWIDESHAYVRELGIDPNALEEEVDREICFLVARFRMIIDSVLRRQPTSSNSPDHE
jgi:hypothetical protein